MARRLMYTIAIAPYTSRDLNTTTGNTATVDPLSRSAGAFAVDRLRGRTIKQLDTPYRIGPRTAAGPG